MKRMIQYIFIVTYIMLIFSFSPVYAATEMPGYIYAAAGKSALKVNNIKPDDIEAQGEDYWARDAVNEMSALSIIKRYGEEPADLNAPVTKAQAQALIYRAVGKEQQVQQVAALIDRQMQQLVQQGNGVETWANGYWALLMAHRLITTEQVDDALYADQSALDSTEQFIKTAPAQRQEIAEWIGKTLKLSPDDELQLSIADTILDKDEIASANIPYVEMAVRENWMTGYNGFFYPKKSISWEEMAQVLKNLEGIILEHQDLVNQFGVVEDIKVAPGLSKEDSSDSITITIKDGEGKIHQIFINQQTETVMGGEDTDQEQQVSIGKETVILAKGKPVDSSYLRKGDRISYVVDESKQVRLIRIIDTTGRIYGMNIANVYKANIYVYDPYEGELVINDLQKWDQGKWNAIIDEQRYKSVVVDHDAVIYAEGKQIDLSYINAYYIDHEVYFVVSTKEDGTESAVLMGITNENSTEQIEDELLAATEKDALIVKGKKRTYKLSENSTIIKDGKIVQKNALAAGDKIHASVVAVDHSDELTAYIVQVYNDKHSKAVVDNKKRKER